MLKCWNELIASFTITVQFIACLLYLLVFLQFLERDANAKRDGISLTRGHLPRSLLYHLSSWDRRVINRNSWNTEFSRLQFTTRNTLHFQFPAF